MNFNETYHNYSLLGPRDSDDIFKVMGLKVKVTDNIFRKCTLPADAYQSTVCHERPSG